MLFDNLRQDVGYALRVLRRSPGFTTVAILSLALGIGANTAVFSLIDALMLRLLPVREPGQLVELLQHYPGEPRGGYWSGASFDYYRDHNHVFSGLTAASAPSRVSVRGTRLSAQMATAQSVAENFFDVLGVQPSLGRGGQALALVSWSFWKTRFHSDPAILGKEIIVQDVPVTIGGVTPPEFFGLQMGSSTELWLPLPLRAPAGLELLGRLKPSVSIEQARAEMTVLYRFTIEERARTSKDALIRQLKLEIEPAGAGLSFPRDQFARPLLALMAVVGLILLIACTNLAGLLLARGATRQKEMSVRVALGAGRLRLMRHVFTEALVLSGLGSMLGVFFAYFGAGALVRMITSGRPIIGLPEPFDLPLRPDTHVLLFTGGIALLTGLLFGLAPAWNAFSLRGVSRSRVFGKALVVAQVGFSVLLLSAAGLFIGRLSDLRHSDLGFRRDHVLLVTLNASGSGYSPEALSHGYQDLLRRMEAIPGVRSATLCGASPLSGAGASGFANGVPRYVSISSVAPKYFETLGIPRLAGRDFNLQDQRVAIVSRAMARDYFPGSDPIGKQVTLEHVTGEREAKTYQIVGVVGDAHLYEISEAPNPTVYLPAFEDGKARGSNFMLRASIEPESEAGVVRSLVSDVLKTVAVTRVTTLADQIDASIVPQRLLASLSGIFGALGSLLAAIGMYGLMAYTVARRIPEFGIRSALGATSNNLLFLVMREAMTLAAAGLLLGGLFASSLLRDAQVASVGSIGFGVLAMLGIALLAAILPARLAAHVEPMEALRHE